MTVKQQIFTSWLLIVFAFHYGAYGAMSIDNAVVGTPDIQCQARQLKVSISTKRPFEGRVFLKGQSHRPECVMDFSRFSESKTLNSTVEVAISYDSCATERIRSLSPNGVTFSNTMIVQFHKTFITSVDKSFNIRCFYAETDKKVDYNFDVSMLTPSPIVHEMAMPQCSYTVRRNTPNGPVIKEANVGDNVYHRWECDGDGSVHGMLVHSCFVEDLSGKMTKIVDEKGCALDDVLLPNLIYNNELNLAYQEAQVFKYPDEAYIHFRCQIRLCTKMDGGCEGMAPPQCNGGQSRLPRRVEFLSPKWRRSVTKATVVEQQRPNIDVVSAKILVLDRDEKFNQKQKLQQFEDRSNESDRLMISDESSSYTSVKRVGALEPIEPLPPWKVCLHRTLLISILVGFFVIFATAFTFIVYVLYRNSEAKRLHTAVDSVYSSGSF